MSDPKNSKGAGPEEEADTASGGATPDTDRILEEETTDESGKPLDNPSG